MAMSGFGEKWLDGPSSDDTIFALSTAMGRAGVAIIRVSGPNAEHALQRLTNRSITPERTACVREIKDPTTGELIDKAMILRFASGASFTGESTVEFHVHGGNAVVAATLDALNGVEGLRTAEPGEFTRRAFENGELDLAQVEGLADLISADTELQRKQAVQILGGELSDRAEKWRADLIFALAMVEATIDWADEEAPVDVSPEALERLRDVQTEVEKEIAGSAAAKSLRDGFEVAVTGSPNVGKSSLINAISRREAAIISPIPGTTRDVIEVRCDLYGAPVTFLDTAGLRNTSDPVETIGVDRALQRSKEANLRILVSSFDDDGSEDLVAGVSAAEIRFWNKSDIEQTAPSDEWIIGSAKTGDGLESLLTGVFQRLQAKIGPSSLAAHERVISKLRSSCESIGSAVRLLETAGESEIASEHIRQAIRYLEEIVGRVEADDMLDVVFSQFCMGK